MKDDVCPSTPGRSTVIVVSHERLLRALPPGGHIWLRAGGRSLWPLVLDADQLLVERGIDLRPGDIAIVGWPDQPLVAHLVQRTQPLVTVSIVGVEDPPEAEALGRVIAVKRGAHRVDLPRSSARLLQWLTRSARWLKYLPGARALVRLLRDS